ncbi:hypothetical protein GCM10027280_35150 [Micromonospora polyrhachis]
MSAAVAAAGLSLLAGCGGTDETPAAGTAKGPEKTQNVADEETAKRQKAENLLADCMKKKGFQYVPRTLEVNRSRTDDFTGASSLLQPADTVRPLREKYGFAIFAEAVYPGDPVITRPDPNPDANPNNKIYGELSAAQQKAYDEALGTDGKSGKKIPGCADEAYGATFGNSGSGDAAAASREWDKFRSDPKVVAAAQKYGDCLRGRGYRITSSEPGLIEQAAAETVLARMPAGGVASMSVEKAKAELVKEVKAALDDLDCRGDYAEIVRTKYPKVVQGGAG